MRTSTLADALQFPRMHYHQVPWELTANEPISIRAELAWRITRGRPDVTVAIIDSGFVLSRLLPEANVDLRSSARRHDHSTESGDHGSLVAELLCGSRRSYPGVAPQCHYLLIELPIDCTEAEECAAFDLALENSAGIVCCSWGFNESFTRRQIPDVVGHAITRLAQTSRHGNGALVLFAAPNNRSNDQDAYLSHSS